MFKWAYSETMTVASNTLQQKQRSCRFVYTEICCCFGMMVTSPNPVPVMKQSSDGSQPKTESGCFLSLMEAFSDLVSKRRRLDG